MFRAAHPDVIIGTGEFGTWQAPIPEPNGETVITRYTLKPFLDKLDELNRVHDVSAMTDSELERARRHLMVSLSLAFPGSYLMSGSCPVVASSCSSLPELPMPGHVQPTVWSLGLTMSQQERCRGFTHRDQTSAEEARAVPPASLPALGAASVVAPRSEHPVVSALAKSTAGRGWWHGLL